MIQIRSTDETDPALMIEDQVVEVIEYPHVVTLGVGAVGYIHSGVVVDATAGSVAYLAPGAHLENARPGELEAGAVSIVEWHPQEVSCAPADGTNS